MKHKELTAELSDQLGWPVQEVNEMLAAMSTIIGSRLVDGDTVCLQQLGQFESRKKMERISVNPVNKKRYLVPPKLVPVFTPGAALQNLLKQTNSHESTSEH